MRVTLARRVPRVRHHHGRVGDLPAVDPLLERLVHGLLDRLDERVRHGTEFDVQADMVGDMFIFAMVSGSTAGTCVAVSQVTLSDLTALGAA